MRGRTKSSVGLHKLCEGLDQGGRAGHLPLTAGSIAEDPEWGAPDAGDEAYRECPV